VTVKEGVTTHKYWMDGFEICISMEYLRTINKEKLYRLIFHEALHDILLHTSRQNRRNQKNWDAAIDTVVENIINKELDFFCDKDTSVYNTNLSAEMLYMDTTYKEGQLERPENCEDNHSMFKPKTANAILKMIKSAEMRVNRSVDPGGVPGFIKEILEGLLSPKSSILEYFNNVVSEHKMKLTSYRRLDRRYLHSGLMTPSSSPNDKIFNILVYVDTSGSMDMKALQQIMSEIFYLISSLKRFNIRIIQGDTEFSTKTTLMDDSNIYLEPFLEIVGRGGTDLGPFIAYLDEGIIEKPDIVIVATDFFVVDKDFERVKSMEGDVVFLVPKNSHDGQRIKQLSQQVFFI